METEIVPQSQKPVTKVKFESSCSKRCWNLLQYQSSVAILPSSILRSFERFLYGFRGCKKNNQQ